MDSTNIHEILDESKHVMAATQVMHLTIVVMVSFHIAQVDVLPQQGLQTGAASMNQQNCPTTTTTFSLTLCESDKRDQLAGLMSQLREKCANRGTLDSHSARLWSLLQEEKTSQVGTTMI